MSPQSLHQNWLQESADDHRSQYKMVRELLYTDSRRQMEPAEAKRLCGQFYNITVVDNLGRIAEVI